MRPNKKRTAFIAVLVILALAVAGIVVYVKGNSSDAHTKSATSASSDNATPKASHPVSSDGGTFAFAAGISVQVPKGAVTGKGVSLKVSTPVAQGKNAHAPFVGLRRANVTFDVSLIQNGRSLQPAKPLQLTAPLKGALLPSGAFPAEALMYTTMPDGHFEPIAATVDTAGVLHAPLSHLSPKSITYIDEKAFTKAFGIDGVQVTRPDDCKTEVTARSTGKVKFGSQTRGWSNSDKDTPIIACLTAGSDGVPRVGIVNKRYYVLSMATTSGVGLSTSPGDTEEELTKAFAKTVFPNKHIKAFLGRDGRAVASTPASSLPARVQVEADPNTFLAEAGWFALTFTVGVLVGEDSPAVAKQAKALLGVPEVIGCLQTALDVSTGDLKDFGFDDAVKLVSGDCLDPIVDALDFEPLDWGIFGKWFDTIGQGLSGGMGAIRTAYEGIRMQGGNPITIQVVAVAPPAPKCPSNAEIVQAWERDMPGATRKSLDDLDYSYSEVDEGKSWNKCVSPWTLTYIIEYDSSHKPIIGTGALLHFEGGRWRVIEFGEQFGSPNTIMCTNKIPAALRPGPWTLADGSTC